MHGRNSTVCGLPHSTSRGVGHSARRGDACGVASDPLTSHGESLCTLSDGIYSALGAYKVEATALLQRLRTLKRSKICILISASRPWYH
jgi:hypothetical protein